MNLQAARVAFVRTVRTRRPLIIQTSGSARRSFIDAVESNGSPVTNDRSDQEGVRGLLSRAFVREAGDLPYGSREYRLYVPNTSHGDPNIGSSRAIATLRAHRNILFGALITTATAAALETTDIRASTISAGGASGVDPPRFPSDTPPPPGTRPLPVDVSTTPLLPLFDPLVKAALVDAGSQGEQPQAVATLHGLCNWVEACLCSANENKPPPTGAAGTPFSKVLNQLMQQNHLEARRIELEAVRAIATGIPRSGPIARSKSKVSSAPSWHGTFRDGSGAWSDLAREYAPRAAEVQLYRGHGAEVTGIELLLPGEPSAALTDDPYRRSAGGAMARMFFL